jgi:hypothetical protein
VAEVLRYLNDLNDTSVEGRQMPETPEQPRTLTGTPSASIGPDPLEVTDDEVGTEIVDEADEEEEWDIVGGLVAAANHLWEASLTRNGEQDVIPPANLRDVEFAVTSRVTKGKEIATFVDVCVRIGRTTHQHTYRADADKQDELMAFLNDRMDNDVENEKWGPEEVLNLLDEVGELMDITIMGKVQQPKNR